MGRIFFMHGNLVRGVAGKIGEGGSAVGRNSLEKYRDSDFVGCHRQGYWRMVLSLN